MKLIIDIPEDEYNVICNGTFDTDGYFRINLSNAFKNGTSLPKGHGRLGDLDALEKLCTEHDIANSAYDNTPIIEQGHYSDGDCIWKPLFDCAPTIIEADAESEDV